MPHPRSPGFQPGNYWAVCDRCGFDYRIRELRMTWDGLLVCEKDWEPRHPQDFVRGVSDTIAPQGPVRPEPTEKTTSVTYTSTDDDNIPGTTFGNSI